MSLLFGATFLSFFSVFYSKIIKIVLDYFLKFKSSLSPLREEIVELEAELSKISMVDEFPKYARLRRKVNVLQDKYNSEVKTETLSGLNARFYASTFLKFLFVCSSIYIFYRYRALPVLKLSPDWLKPFPFPHILSWPSTELGGISFLAWFSMCNQVLRIILTR